MSTSNQPLSSQKNISPPLRREQIKAVSCDTGFEPKKKSQSPKSNSRKLRSPASLKAKDCQSQFITTAPQSKCSDGILAKTRIGVSSSRHLLNSKSASSLDINKECHPHFVPEPEIPKWVSRLARDMKRRIAAGQTSYRPKRTLAMLKKRLSR